MCAWVRCCGGSAKRKLSLYENGTWKVGYDNYGSYYYTGIGAPYYGWVLNSDRFTSVANQTNIIGTSNTINVTDYTKLHVVAKSVTNEGGFSGMACVGTSKDVQPATKVNITNGSYTEYIIDVTNMTNVYISFFSHGNRVCDVKEVFLT